MTEFADFFKRYSRTVANKGPWIPAPLLYFYKIIIIKNRYKLNVFLSNHENKIDSCYFFMEYCNVYLIYLCTFYFIYVPFKSNENAYFDTKTAKQDRYVLYVGRNFILSYILTIFTAYSWLSWRVRVYTMNLKSHRPAAYTIWLRENGQHVD